MKEMRDYQVDCLNAIEVALLHRDSTLAVLATGLGKTVIFSRLARDWKDGNVLVLAHRTELIEQAQDKLGSELGYAPPIEKAEHAVDPSCMWTGGNVVVGSVQTMRNDARIEKFRDHRFGLCIIDEAHHATAASYQKVVDKLREFDPFMKILGVTATPRRTDDAALGTMFQPAPQPEHGGACYRFDIADAIPKGWLVPIHQEFVTVEGLSLDMGSRPNEMGESDLDRTELEAVLTEERSLQAMVGPVLEKSTNRSTLVFCAGVGHAHLFAQILNRYKPDSAAAVDGKTDKVERKAIVSRFKNGDLQYLCNYGVFTEGFDAPQTSLIVMARPTKSLLLYTQMLGRGLRPIDGLLEGLLAEEIRCQAIANSEKPYLLNLDFVGNSRHKLISSVDVLGGNYDVTTRELAAQNLKKNGGNVDKAIAAARAQILSEQEAKKRQHIKGKDWKFSAEGVDPFGNSDAPSEQHQVQTRGGSTDAQIALLVNLGVVRETASLYGKKQAGSVIDKLTITRCTVRQLNILREKSGGIVSSPTQLNMDQASAMIDRIAKNGWRWNHAWDSEIPPAKD